MKTPIFGTFLVYDKTVKMVLIWEPLSGILHVLAENKHCFTWFYRQNGVKTRSMTAFSGQNHQNEPKTPNSVKLLIYSRSMEAFSGQTVVLRTKQ